MTGSAPTCDLSLKELLRDAVDGFFIIDRQRRVTYFSEGCERITGVHSSLVLGCECACHRLTDCRDERDRSLGTLVLCPAIKIFRGEVANHRQRMSVRHRFGCRVWVETTYSPVRDETGRIIAVVGIMRDISESLQREQTSEGAERTSPEAGSIYDLEARVSAMRAAATSGPTEGSPSLDRLLAQVERHEILSALEQAQGNRGAAARLLGISRSRLYRRMHALMIDPGTAWPEDM